MVPDELCNVLPLSGCCFESLERKPCSCKRAIEGHVNPCYSFPSYLDVNYQATDWYLKRRRNRFHRHPEFVSLDKFSA